jgi:hypothetical protein
MAWEYVGTYVDDIMIAMKDPAEFIETLKKEYKFKFKGDGPIDFHLGLNYIRDKDGTLRTEPVKYLDKMFDTYERMFGTQPKPAATPLEKGDHPELDESPLCDEEDASKVLSMIGQLQWLITLGRFDIYPHLNSVSRFRLAPRKGHLDRLKRIYGYLKGRRDGTIRIRTDQPDYSQYPDQHFDWAETIYSGAQEEIPDDAPEPLGKSVVLTTFVDANLYHDMISGKALTAVLHMINQTPFDWYTKKQATCETATFGAEFVAAKTAVEQIQENRLTLRYLGVPIQGKTYMFGDNQSVVTNGTLPHSQLSKRHNALSYHKVRESVASGMIGFYHIAGNRNPADILSKHWGFQQVWWQLKSLLFWMGDTSNIKTKVATRQSSTSERTRGECHESNHIPSSVAHLKGATHITRDIWQLEFKG